MNNNSKSVVLMVFHSVPQAQVILGLLNSNGVKCFLSNKEGAILHSLYSNDSGIRLHVMEDDVATAKEILTSSWEENS